MRLILIRHGQSLSLVQSGDEEILADDVNFLTDEGRAINFYTQIAIAEFQNFARICVTGAKLPRSLIQSNSISSAALAFYSFPKLLASEALDAFPPRV